MTQAELEHRQRQAAETQSMFREINKRMRATYAAESISGERQFVCECAHARCTETITMSLDEYDAIRRIPTHFVVRAGSEHFFHYAERIVDSCPDYIVVEKYGAAGTHATALDLEAG